MQICHAWSYISSVLGGWNLQRTKILPPKYHLFQFKEALMMNYLNYEGLLSNSLLSVTIRFLQIEKIFIC